MLRFSRTTTATPSGSTRAWSGRTARWSSPSRQEFSLATFLPVRACSNSAVAPAAMPAGLLSTDGEWCSPTSRPNWCRSRASTSSIAREYLRDAGPGVECIAQADARDLSVWRDGEFDAVVALGPFYHLTSEEDRRRASEEIARVLRPGGVACAAVIPRHAILRGLLLDASARHRMQDAAFLSQILEEGVFISDQPDRFTGIYGVQPGEPASDLPSPDLAPVAVHAIEGFVSDLQGQVAALQREAHTAYELLLEELYKRSTDPVFFGTSNHLLVVTQKAGPSERPPA